MNTRTMKFKDVASYVENKFDILVDHDMSYEGKFCGFTFACNKTHSTRRIIISINDLCCSMLDKLANAFIAEVKQEEGDKSMSHNEIVEYIKGKYPVRAYAEDGYFIGGYYFTVVLEYGSEYKECYSIERNQNNKEYMDMIAKDFLRKIKEDEKP